MFAVNKKESMQKLDPKPDPVERILNMDEEMFRRLINMPKIQKVDLQRQGDQEIATIV